jgi:hypothetical protein
LKRTSDKSLFPMALGSCGHRITHQLRPINMNGRSILSETSIMTFPTKVPSDSLGWIGRLKRTSDKSLFPMALGRCGHRFTHQLRPINMNGRSILSETSIILSGSFYGLRKRDRSDIVKLGDPADVRAIFTRARHFDFGPPFAGDPWGDRPTLGPDVSRLPSAIPAGQRGGPVARSGEALPVPARRRLD